jgi:hypothetical protein
VAIDGKRNRVVATDGKRDSVSGGKSDGVSGGKK